MNAAMNTYRFQTIRERLTARREELRQRLERVSADQRRAAEPLSADAPDRISQTENDEVVDEIGSSAHAELAAIDWALRRLEAGRYGLCESCEHPIEAIRLAVVPHASRCVRCSTEPERKEETP